MDIEDTEGGDEEEDADPDERVRKPHAELLEKKTSNKMNFIFFNSTLCVNEQCTKLFISQFFLFNCSKV